MSTTTRSLASGGNLADAVRDFSAVVEGARESTASRLIASRTSFLGPDQRA